MKKNNKKLSTAKNVNLTLFSEASIKAQEQRHKALDTTFDKALQIVGNILNDAGKSDAVKLFPAKLAIDTYLFKEKLLREDAKYEIEKEKLEIEKAKLSVPGGPLYIIQNVENQQNNNVTVKDAASKETLKDRKRLQAELLEKVSGIAQFSEIKKDD